MIYHDCDIDSLKSCLGGGVGDSVGVEAQEGQICYTDGATSDCRPGRVDSAEAVISRVVTTSIPTGKDGRSLPCQCLNEKLNPPGVLSPQSITSTPSARLQTWAMIYSFPSLALFLLLIRRIPAMAIITGRGSGLAGYW